MTLKPCPNCKRILTTKQCTNIGRTLIGRIELAHARAVLAPYIKADLKLISTNLNKGDN